MRGTRLAAAGVLAMCLVTLLPVRTAAAPLPVGVPAGTVGTVEGSLLSGDLGLPSTALPVAMGVCDVPLVGGVCAAGSAVLSLPGTIVSGVAGAVVGEAERAFTAWVADAAASVLGGIVGAADSTLQPDLSDQGALAQSLGPMLGLAGGVATLVLLLAVGQALVRADPAAIVHTVAVRVPGVFLLSAALLFITRLAVTAVDEATRDITGGRLEASTSATMQHLAGAFSSADPGTSQALLAICAIGTILVGLLLYIELAMRVAVIYLAVLFLPLTLAAAVWGRAATAARRLADILVVAVLAKLVILVALWFGATLLDHSTSSGGGQGFGGLLVGLVILLLAAASPLVLLGFVSHAEAGIAQLGGVRQGARTTVQAGMRTASAAGGGLAPARAASAAGAARAARPAASGGSTVGRVL